MSTHKPTTYLPSRLAFGGMIVGFIGLICVIGSLVAYAVIGIAGHATKPPPLLPAPPTTTTTEQRDVLVSHPAQSVRETVVINTRHGDREAARAFLRHAVDKWQGNPMERPDNKLGVTYAVPESAARWMTTLGREHGQDAYAAISSAPPATVGPDNPMTEITVHMGYTILRRESITDLFEWTLMVMIAGIALVTVGFSFAGLPGPRRVSANSMIESPKT